MLLRWDIENPGQMVLLPTPLPTWDGVSYVDSHALSTFRTGTKDASFTAVNENITAVDENITAVKDKSRKDKSRKDKSRKDKGRKDKGRKDKGRKDKGRNGRR
jgi:hypothetical protein